MKLTGKQVATLAELTDGADIYLVQSKGESRVSFTRIEDELTGYIDTDGIFVEYVGQPLVPGDDPRD